MKRDKIIKMRALNFLGGKAFEGDTPSWFDRPFLCLDGGLDDYFDIPEDTKTIYIRLSKKPSEGAYKIKFRDRDEAALIHTKDKVMPRRLTYSTDAVMKSYGFPFYVSVEY